MGRCLQQLLLGVGLAQLLACTASPPPHADGKPVVGPGTPYPKRAVCTPPQGHSPPPCPGTLCADNALDAPDGKTVDLTSCVSLDLVFTDVTVIASTKQDLEITLGTAAGATRVEASMEGSLYELLGYIAQTPSALPFPVTSECLATPSGGAFLLSLSRCRQLSQARFLRLSPDTRSSGFATIDAVRAISFAKAN